MGLIQREIESRGIRTASIIHLLGISKKVRPPRMFFVHYPLGCTFGYSGEMETHEQILIDLLNFAICGGDEEVKKSNYGK